MAPAARFAEAPQPLASDSDETDMEEASPLLSSSRAHPSAGHCGVQWSLGERLVVLRVVLSAALVATVLAVKISGRGLHTVDQLRPIVSTWAQEGLDLVRKDDSEDLRRAAAADWRGEKLGWGELKEELKEISLEEEEVREEEEEDEEQGGKAQAAIGAAANEFGTQRVREWEGAGGCFERGVLYPMEGAALVELNKTGGTLRVPPAWPFVGFHQTELPEECQVKCQQNSACRYFTFRSPGKECFLLSSRGSEPLRTGLGEGVVSGPRRCSGVADLQE